MLYERRTDNKNAVLCQKCENVDTTFFTSMNKHESTSYSLYDPLVFTDLSLYIQ